MDASSKPAKKLGRPRIITPDRERPILDAIAGGLSVKEACAQAGVSYQSFQRRWADDEAFRNRSARAYLHRTIFYLNNAEARLETSTPKTIAVAREIAHHARWRASRLVPAFSEKLAVGVTDQHGFFGTPQSTASPPTLPSDDPRVSWQRKTYLAWSREEQVEAAKTLCYEQVEIGVRLARKYGLGERYVEAHKALALSIQHDIEHGVDAAQCVQRPALPATVTIEPVMEPQPDAESARQRKINENNAAAAARIAEQEQRDRERAEAEDDLRDQRRIERRCDAIRESMLRPTTAQRNPWRR